MKAATGERGLPLVDPMKYLGEVLCRTGHTDSGLASLREALGLIEQIRDPGHGVVAEVRVRLGECMLLRGNWQEATTQFAAAVEPLHDNPGGWLELARAAFGMTRSVCGTGKNCRAGAAHAERARSILAQHPRHAEAAAWIREVGQWLKQPDLERDKKQG